MGKVNKLPRIYNNNNNNLGSLNLTNLTKHCADEGLWVPKDLWNSKEQSPGAVYHQERVDEQAASSYLWQ